MEYRRWLLQALVVLSSCFVSTEFPDNRLRAQTTTIAGWTVDQLRAAWGPPRRSETGSDGIETWFYELSIDVSLDVFMRGGRVIGWKPLNFPLTRLDRPAAV